MPQPRFTPPRQARSRATLERIADTARKTLETRRWRALRVNRLCAASGSSVGAFYARFRDKDALLAYLTGQAEEEYEAVVTWFCTDVEQRHLPLASRLRQLVAALWRYTDRHAGVLRALIELRRPLPFDQRPLAADLAATLHPGDRGDLAADVLLDILRARVIKNTPPGQPNMAVTQVLDAYLR